MKNFIPISIVCWHILIGLFLILLKFYSEDKLEVRDKLLRDQVEEKLLILLQSVDFILLRSIQDNLVSSKGFIFVWKEIKANLDSSVKKLTKSAGWRGITNFFSLWSFLIFLYPSLSLFFFLDLGFLSVWDFFFK